MDNKGVKRLLTEIKKLGSVSDAREQMKRLIERSQTAPSLPAETTGITGGFTFGGIPDTTHKDQEALAAYNAKLKQEYMEAIARTGEESELDTFRHRLPINEPEMVAEVLAKINKFRVVVLSGETGCGKTTQLPQIILNDALLNNKGAHTMVLCTQPRRISAISVAERVAQERHEKLGGSVGYQIRLERVFPARGHAAILYMTTGVLLRRLQVPGALSDVSHVILDEIHERNLNEDFVLVVLTRLIKQYPHIHVILMSATLTADVFVQYFKRFDIECGSVHIKGRTFPVTEYFLEDVLALTNYVPPTAPAKIEHDKDSLGKAVKQVHLVSKPASPAPDFVYSEGLSKEQQSRLNNMEAMERHTGKIDLDCVVALIHHIHCTTPTEGSVLVFLPGWDDISKLLDLLKTTPVVPDKTVVPEDGKYLPWLTHLGGSPCEQTAPLDNFSIIPLHSMIPTVSQRLVFGPAPPGKRKVILSTNIAETSITVEDVVYVVDCGRTKIQVFDPSIGVSCLAVSKIAKGSAIQRAGRAGRCKPGVCFHMFSHDTFEQLPTALPPEMKRVGLEEVVLQIRVLDLGEAESFLNDALEPPPQDLVYSALSTLVTVGAIDMQQELTTLGRVLARLPVDPRLGKMLVYGLLFHCIDAMLTLVAFLSVKDPFVMPVNKQKAVEASRRNFCGITKSDHIGYLNVYAAYIRQKEQEKEDKFCWDNFLSKSTMSMVVNIRYQLVRILTESKLLTAKLGTHDYMLLNSNTNDHEIVKAILYASIGTCIRIEQHRHPQLYLPSGDKARLHPSSALNHLQTAVKPFRHPFLAYWGIQETSRVFIKDASEITPTAVLVLGPAFKTLYSPDQASSSVDYFNGDIMGLESAQTKGVKASSKKAKKAGKNFEVSIGHIVYRHSQGQQESMEQETAWWLPFDLDPDIYELITLSRDWSNVLLDLFFCERLLPASAREVPATAPDLPQDDEADKSQPSSLLEEFERRKKREDKRKSKGTAPERRTPVIGPIVPEDATNEGPGGAEYYKKLPPKTLWSMAVRVLKAILETKVTVDMPYDRHYKKRRQKYGKQFPDYSEPGSSESTPKGHKHGRHTPHTSNDISDDVKAAMAKLRSRQEKVIRKSRSKGKGKTKKKMNL